MLRKCLLVCLFTMTFFGCATRMPLVSTLRDSSIPKEEHSVLSMTFTMVNVRIDGQRVTSGSGAGYGSKAPIILLPPGKHTVVASYQRDMSNTSQTVIEHTGDLSIEYEFSGSRFYHLFPVFNGNTVSLRIVDETDPFVWENSQERGRAQLRVDNARKAIAGLK